jgi:hypothetical protein
LLDADRSVGVLRVAFLFIWGFNRAGFYQDSIGWAVVVFHFFVPSAGTILLL